MMDSVRVNLRGNVLYLIKPSRDTAELIVGTL